jgi:acetyl-CoA carboxylase alpha subunit
MNRFDELFNAADAALNANEKYKVELQALKGLSPEEIASITPDTDEHAALIKVVQQASKENLSKAQLVDNIKALGAVAVKIAKKIPQFTELL